MFWKNCLKKLAIRAVRFYQIAISPHLPKACRFYPSCSDYCILAIQKKGILKGLLKGCWRILRCNPLCKGGIDLPI